MSYKVDVGIPCSASQHPTWWSSLLGNLLQETQRGIELGQIMAVSSALPDHNKNAMIGGSINVELNETKKRNELTDSNRAAISRRFLTGDEDAGWKADWIFWIDDDTVIPEKALTSLLEREKDFIAGLYFNANPPKNPIAYVRNKEGIGYHALYDYPTGSLIQVDSVGMGCTLIHRSVFEKIMAAHRIYTRPNGSCIAIHKDKIKELTFGPKLSSLLNGEEEALIDGYYVVRAKDPDPDDTRAWPFYAMEYGRTEDHHFCEMAAAVGVRPWVDTTITCGHIKPQSVGYQDYKEYLNAGKGSGTR